MSDGTRLSPKYTRGRTAMRDGEKEAKGWRKESKSTAVHARHLCIDTSYPSTPILPGRVMDAAPRSRAVSAGEWTAAAERSPASRGISMHARDTDYSM